MNVDPKDDLDHAIDGALASIVGGEPRRVSAASVRKAMGESRGSRLPIWLALAAILIVSLAVVLKGRPPIVPAPVGLAHAVPSTEAIEVRSVPSAEPTQALGTRPSSTASSKPSVVATTTEPVYEGLPRLSIASIDPPEPLRPARLEADPIQISRIEIAPLAVSSLSDEPEHKQEPPK